MLNATYEFQRRPGALNSFLGSNPFDQAAYPPGPTRQFAMSKWLLTSHSILYNGNVVI